MGTAHSIAIEARAAAHDASRVRSSAAVRRGAPRWVAASASEAAQTDGRVAVDASARCPVTGLTTSGGNGQTGGACPVLHGGAAPDGSGNSGPSPWRKIQDKLAEPASDQVAVAAGASVSSSSSTTTTTTTTTATGAACPDGKCDLKRGGPVAAPPAALAPAPAATLGGSHGDGSSGDEPRVQPKVYNVYGKEIDPTNNMPLNPNQLPAPGQTAPLSVDRVVSSIPKGGTATTWTFPSAQMFYNALARKGKVGDDLTLGDVETIVTIHNNMNERTWAQVALWERALHGTQCADPRLSRFLGRPHDLSPRARVLTWLGYDAPFDRHDWIVDRCGTEVRYIIDFYYDPTKGSADQLPALHDETAIQSISMVVRPALDSLGAVADVARMAFLRLTNASVLHPQTAAERPPVRVLRGVDAGAPQLALPADAASATPGYFQAVNAHFQLKCSPFLLAAAECASANECELAAYNVRLCLGAVVCPAQTQALVAAQNEAAQEVAFNSVVSCVDRFDALLEASYRAAQPLP